MPYDANDPETKAAVQAAIDAALETEREEHEGRVAILDNKNRELLGKLAKARKDGGGDNADEIIRLEAELDDTRRDLGEAKRSLSTTERKLKAVETERDTAARERDSERNYSNSQLIENSLTTALVDAKVAPHFMEAAKALLSKSITVEVDGDERKVLANGKSVGDFVKEWSAGDAGKHYIQAPANGGGGASGPNGNGNPNAGGKALKDMSEQERTEMERTDPAGFRAKLEAEGPTPVSIAA